MQLHCRNYEANKRWQELNRAKLRESQKKYYFANKEERNKKSVECRRKKRGYINDPKLDEKVICKYCRYSMKKRNFSRHNKSMTHIKNLINKKNCEVECYKDGVKILI